jgi:hypothetical protein
MITLRWAPYPGSTVTGYKVYRSIIGFMANLVSPLSDITGLTLELKMNGGPLQTITFDGITPIVEFINTVLTGGRAYLSLEDASQFIVRSDVRVAPGSVEIIGGTALTLLGLTVRLIEEMSEDSMIKSVPALPDPNTLVEFQDDDGTLQDWYAVSTLDSLHTESNKTPYKQPITSSGKICVIEGIVTNLQGVRLPDVEIVATLVKFPHAPETASQVTLQPIVTLTGSDGRFSLALLQGALVQFDIPSVGFSRNITIPEKAYEFITDILVDLDYQYPLEYR